MCDEKYIAKMLDGDIYAANKLIKKHKADLMGFCRTRLLDSDLAQDCYQITWEKAFRKIHTFKLGSSFKSWIFKICQNTIYDELRRQRARTRGTDSATKLQLDIEYYESLLAQQKSTEQLTLDKEQRAELLTAVFSLPDKLKDIVVLRFFHSKKFVEISPLLSMSESTVKYKLNKAIILMKKELGDDWYV
ncbi:MAG: sigma-70 family RNA polymerase sigma factor [Clostridia bacterium]|nr:sigma-70 family RNA polymerase sigma factor [Clostridia bacterium]MBT7121792.1 sigma-70 family RNA polymerase sigma factor [Clostridia bacterium]